MFNRRSKSAGPGATRALKRQDERRHLTFIRPFIKKQTDSYSNNPMRDSEYLTILTRFKPEQDIVWQKKLVGSSIFASLLLKDAFAFGVNVSVIEQHLMRREQSMF